MSDMISTSKVREYCTNTICGSCGEIEELKAKVRELKNRNDKLNNYGILIEDIRNYCRLQPKTNYIAQRILEAIEKGYWG